MSLALLFDMAKSIGLPSDLGTLFPSFLWFLAKALDVFRTFLQRSNVTALHEHTNLLDDIGIRERADVSSVHTIGNGGENAAHDLAGAGLGHVRNNMDVLRPGDFADDGFDGYSDLILHRFVGKNARLERNVHDWDAAFDFVYGRNDRRFGDLRKREAGRFDFLGTEAMARDVDDVVNATEDAVITVGRKHSTVRSVIGPVAPILAARVLVVFFVVLSDEALRIAPDGLHDARPGIADANVSSLVRARRNFFSVLIPNHRINAENRRARATGLHGIESRFGGAEEAAGFGLPPGVNDHRFAFAHNIVIPPPNIGLDGFADRGHVLEMVVVFLGLVRAGLAKHTNGGGRSVEDVDVEAFGDAPGAARVRELGNAFAEDACCSERQRTVDDVGVAGDPADVGHAPVHVLGMNVLVILGRAGDVGEITTGAMLTAFGFACRAAGVHEEERGFRVLRDGLDSLAAIVLEDIINEVVASHDHGRFGGVFSGIALPNEDLVDLLPFLLGGLHGNIGTGLVINPLAVAVIAVGIDEDTAAGIGSAKTAGFTAEATEDNRVNDD